MSFRTHTVGRQIPQSEHDSLAESMLKYSGPRDFTIVELLIAIVMIAILAAKGLQDGGSALRRW